MCVQKKNKSTSFDGQLCSNVYINVVLDLW